jgi:hypothetical protein
MRGGQSRERVFDSIYESSWLAQRIRGFIVNVVLHNLDRFCGLWVAYNWRMPRRKGELHLTTKEANLDLCAQR